MCVGGGGGTDNSALMYQQNQDRQARADEEARQQRIAVGRQQIDALFDRGQTLVPGTGTVTPAKTDVTPGFLTPLMLSVFGEPKTAPTTVAPQFETTQPAFDDAFYDKRRQAILANQTPQLQDQYQKAREGLTYALARAGITRSSAGADKSAQLKSQYDVESANVANKAEQDVSGLRGQVEDARTNLITQLQATADPAGSANQALARTQVLRQQPLSYDTIGDVFSGVAAGVGNFVQGVRQKQLFDTYNTAKANPATGGGGGRSHTPVIQDY